MTIQYFEEVRIMQLKYINSLGLLGYIIIVNNEIHSRQIKWLNIVLKRYEFDDELSIINDILNDKDEKIQYNECLFAFQQECLETKEFIYRTYFQLAVIDDDNISTHRIDSQENGILKNIEDSIGNISFQQRQALKNIDRNLYAQTSKDIDFSDFDFGAILNVAEDDYEEYEYTFDRIFSECRILTTRLENKLEVTETSQIEKVLKSFIGKQQQMPPIYSAIKVNGKKLYEYARKGQNVEIKPREIEIYDIKEKTAAQLNSSFPDTLKKSVLQDAVQGKLVLQDSADEPCAKI